MKEWPKIILIVLAGSVALGCCALAAHCIVLGGRSGAPSTLFVDRSFYCPGPLYLTKEDVDKLPDEDRLRCSKTRYANTADPRVWLWDVDEGTRYMPVGGTVEVWCNKATGKCTIQTTFYYPGGKPDAGPQPSPR